MFLADCGSVSWPSAQGRGTKRKGPEGGYSQVWFSKQILGGKVVENTYQVPGNKNYTYRLY